MRIEERAWTARGEDDRRPSTSSLRHPGDAQGHDHRPGHGHRRRLRALDLGRRDRPDLLGRRIGSGTQRPVRRRPSCGLGRTPTCPARHASTTRSRRCRPRRCPRRSSIRPATARTCSRPACCDRRRTRRSSTAARRSWSSATTRARSSWRPTGRTSASRSRSTATTGVILRLVEIDRRRRHPRRPVIELGAGRAPARRPRSTSSSPPGRRCSTDRLPESTRRPMPSRRHRAGMRDQAA